MKKINQRFCILFFLFLIFSFFNFCVLGKDIISEKNSKNEVSKDFSNKRGVDIKDLGEREEKAEKKDKINLDKVKSEKGPVINYPKKEGAEVKPTKSQVNYMHDDKNQTHTVKDNIKLQQNTKNDVDTSRAKNKIKEPKVKVQNLEPNKKSGYQKNTDKNPEIAEPKGEKQPESVEVSYGNENLGDSFAFIKSNSDMSFWLKDDNLLYLGLFMIGVSVLGLIFTFMPKRKIRF